MTIPFQPINLHILLNLLCYSLDLQMLVTVPFQPHYWIEEGCIDSVHLLDVEYVVY